MAIKNSQQGLTLIELLVVMGIVAIVSSVLIFNYSDFGSNIALTNLSQDIALSIRKAQAYATSVQGISSSGVSTITFPGYGISFSNTAGVVSADPIPNQKQFIFFADIPNSGNTTGDNFYHTSGNCGNPSVGDECIEKLAITSADSIIKIITTDASGNQTTLPTDSTVNVVFDRPIPDANICVENGSVCSTNTPSSVEIIIGSAGSVSTVSEQRTITVWNTGQISTS